MATILGGLIGAWLLYAILALLFKHLASWIIVSIIGLGTGVAMLLVGDFGTIISVVIFSVLVFAIPQIQVKNGKKSKK